MKGHIDEKYRIPWLNLATSYLEAARVILERMQEPVSSEEEKWRNGIMAVPLLYLLRQTLELSIKSIFISNNESFDLIHDFTKFMPEAEKFIDITDPKIYSQWDKIKNLANDFIKTSYDGKRLFNNDDLNSTALRYLQVDSFDNYIDLKNIDYKSIFERVHEARIMCELFTLKWIKGE